MPPDRELAKLRDDLFWKLGRIVDALDGLTDDELRWAPDADAANSLAEIATHAISGAEHHIFGLLLQERDVGTAFETNASGAEIRRRLEETKARIAKRFARIDPSELLRERPTVVGLSTGRECLLWAVMHAAEHVGAAELTRGMALRRRPGPTGSRDPAPPRA